MPMRQWIPDPVKTALRPGRRALSRQRHAHLIEASGVFDVEWYEAQAGKAFSSKRKAILDYLDTPRALGRSPHPLFEAEWVDPQGWLKRETDPFVWYLTARGARGRETHPLLPGGSPTAQAWLDRVRALRTDSIFGPNNGQTAPWGEVRQGMLSAVVEHSRQVHLAAAPRIQDHLPHLPIDAVHQVRGPLVSIVLPTWNRARVLRRAIDSVRAQSYADWELIVVDDGSTDDTAYVLQGLEFFDDRVKVVQADHVGVCRARNAGLARCRGRYVAFLDSDNTWLPDYLGAMVSALEGNGWEMAHAAMRVNDGGQARYRFFEGDLESLLVANHVDLNVLIARRDLLERVGGFDESLRRAVDYDLILRLAEHSPLHAVPVIGADYSEDRADKSRISVSEPHSWNNVVRGRHLVTRQRQTTELVQGRVSVVLPVRRNIMNTVRWLDGFASEAWGGEDVELVIVGSGISRAHVSIATGLAAVTSGVSVVRTATHVGTAVATNIGLALSTGDTVVLARPNTTPAAGWLGPLIDALTDETVGLVQPLLINVDGTISSAGAVFAPGDPYPSPLLAGYPVSDALRVGSGAVPAAYGGVVAMRTRDARRLQGLDALLDNAFTDTDLSLRSLAADVGRTELCVDSQLTARSLRRYGFDVDAEGSAKILRARWSGGAPGSETVLQRAGFDVLGYQTVFGAIRKDGKAPVLGRRPRMLRSPVQVIEGCPRLRWTIDTAAPSGPRGELWGDTHFARSLAKSLERLGQEVTVDPREARNRPSRDDDDVLLVLRGLDQVEPTIGGIAIEWVISHPEQVSAREAAQYDAVFAASIDWANRKTAEWGVTVDPLLQCTDPDLFHPDRGEADSGPTALFVGNSRKVDRPMVRAAVAAGAELHVYGSGWEGLLAPEFVKGNSIANTQLGSHYASASLVLNDHWDDMRRDGFLSNRLFDAVASGARVVSDDVPGLRKVFGDSVAVVRSVREMRQLMDLPFSETFPLLEARREAAHAIHDQHSFDRRAKQLLDRAVALWSREAPRLARIDGLGHRA